MEEQEPTANSEQLALLREHVALQKEELAEQSEKNRADEQNEARRLENEVTLHEKNLEHAGKVLSAQANDRQQVRVFWSSNLKLVFWLFLALLFLSSAICGIAIIKGESAAVFAMLGKVVTYGMTLLAGIGVDRVWVHRKNSSLSSRSESEGDES